MDFIQGRLAERFPLKYEGQVANPSLDPEEVVVGDHRAIDHHDVGRGRLIDLRDQVLPEGQQYGDGAGIEVALCAKVANDEAAVAYFVTRLFEKVLKLGQGSDTRPPFHHPEDRVGFILQPLELLGCLLAAPPLELFCRTLFFLGRAERLQFDVGVARNVVVCPNIRHGHLDHVNAAWSSTR